MKQLGQWGSIFFFSWKYIRSYQKFSRVRLMIDINQVAAYFLLVSANLMVVFSMKEMKICYGKKQMPQWIIKMISWGTRLDVLVSLNLRGFFEMKSWAFYVRHTIECVKKSANQKIWMILR